MGMSTPKIDAILNQADPRRVARFEAAKNAIEDGIAAKQIWNSDFEYAKDQLSRSWDAVEDKAHEYLTDLYFRGKDVWRTWQDNDPRHNMGNHPLLNVPGYLAKLQKVKNAPELADYIAVLKEAAPLGAMLKEIKPYIVKGRKPNPNPTPVDLSNTGTCPICQRMFKMYSGATMVDHGFQISDGYGNYFGFRSGKCFGVGKVAYELSCEANKEFLVVVQNALVAANERLQNLNDGKVTELPYVVTKRTGFGKSDKEFKTTRPGEPEWERAFRHEVYQATNRVEGLKNEIEAQNKLIVTWTLKPLPGQAK